MDDREIARRAMDYQQRARSYGLVEIPAYKTWAARKLEEGTSEAFIAHLDAMSMHLLPEEVGDVSEDAFEELLSDIAEACGGE